MTDVPFAPTGTGVRLAADSASNSVAAIGAGSTGGGYVRIVNMSAVAGHIAAGTDASVDATNTDFALLASSAAIMAVGPGITHISVQPVSGSNNVFIIQRGQIG